MGKYTLMNKHKRIADIVINSNEVHIINEYVKLPRYMANTDNWIKERISLYSRTNILDIARRVGIKDKESFIDVTKAISVTDTFWVNNEENPVNWNEINPYKNKISEVIANIALNGFNGYIGEDINSPSPQYRLDGSVEKCVKKINGYLYLYKTDGEKWSELAGLRPYSEYFAHQIAKKLGVPNYVEYKVKEKITNNGLIKPYSICKMFTSEEQGLVQISSTTLKNKHINEFSGVIPNKSMAKLKDMAVMDSIIVNCDRHTGNYGFIVDNDTMKLKDISPIYDNDCSLGSLVSMQYKSFDEIYKEVINKRPKLGFHDYNEMARWGMTKQMLNRIKKAGYIEIESEFKGINKRRRMFIEYLVNRRMKEILDMFK